LPGYTNNIAGSRNLTPPTPLFRHVKIQGLGHLNAASSLIDPAQRRTTILVVEDDVLVRLGLAEELRDQDYVVIEAANADEALAVLQSDIAVDVMLTDIQMPGSINGIGLARLVRAQFPTIKVLVASGRVPESEVAPVSIDGFFSKPYDFQALLERIKSLLA
jgi:CheY-like chemotaxis protein